MIFKKMFISAKLGLIMFLILLFTFLFVFLDKMSAEIYSGVVTALAFAYIEGNVRSKKYENNFKEGGTIPPPGS